MIVLGDDGSNLESQIYQKDQIFPLINQLWADAYPQIMAEVISGLMQKDHSIATVFKNVSDRVVEMMRKMIGSLFEKHNKSVQNLAETLTNTVMDKMINVYELAIETLEPTTKKMTGSP